jgi:hypothetical protein
VFYLLIEMERFVLVILILTFEVLIQDERQLDPINRILHGITSVYEALMSTCPTLESQHRILSTRKWLLRKL